MCIPLLMTGCIIIRGGWTVRTNSPPEVLLVEPLDVIVLDTERQAVTVQFTDPDEEALVFTWLIAGNPIDQADVETFSSRSDGPIVWTSRAFVRLPVAADGDQVTCLVTDGEDVSRVDWTVEVP